MTTSNDRRHLCQGAQDEIGAVCDGPNIRDYVARDLETGGLFTARWCSDCAALARAADHDIREHVALLSFTLERDGNILHFLALPTHGCFAAIARSARFNYVFIAPMNLDGTPDFDNIGEVEDISDQPEFVAGLKVLFNVTTIFGE